MTNRWDSMRMLRRFFGAVAFLASPPLIAAYLGMLPGEGSGIVDAYDPVRQLVVVGQREAVLSPRAAESLRNQLSQHGLSAASRFAARFSVVAGAEGRAVIDSIYVVPPKAKR
jgi:hypothetical protein